MNRVTQADREKPAKTGFFESRDVLSKAEQLRGVDRGNAAVQRAKTVTELAGNHDGRRCRLPRHRTWRPKTESRPRGSDGFRAATFSIGSRFSRIGNSSLSLLPVRRMSPAGPPPRWASRRSPRQRPAASARLDRVDAMFLTIKDVRFIGELATALDKDLNSPLRAVVVAAAPVRTDANVSSAVGCRP